MKLYDEIKDIITNKLGIKDMPTYEAYTTALWNKEGVPRPLTPEELEQLSPDVVHNGDFWKVIEELCGVDCVANTQYGKTPFDTYKGNRNNIHLARSMGALNSIDNNRWWPLDVLEIGAGYGNFKNYCMMNTNFNYTGIDAWPKTDGVIATTPEGLMPDAVKQKKYHIVYSSNVFQHLSSKQRSQYLKDMALVLTDDGFLDFNLMLTTPAEKKQRMADGKVYLKHYGQFTEIPDYYEFVNEIYANGFYIQYETRRTMDGFFNFVCPRQAKPLESKVEEKKEELCPTTKES